MKEIKFRAWLWSDNHTNDQWIYSEMLGMIRFWQSFYSWTAHKELMQYTGLKDKNGNREEIYEKDIMEFYAYGKRYIGVVEYCGSAFGIICRTASGVKASPYLDDAINRHEAVKIGNIHNNPELLARTSNKEVKK